MSKTKYETTRLPTKTEKKISGFSPRKEALNKIENGINAFMVQIGLIPTKKKIL